MATQAAPRRTTADPRAADRGALLRAVSAELCEGRRTSIGRARLHRELAARGLRPSELVPLAFCDPATGLGDRWAFARDLEALAAGPGGHDGVVVLDLSLQWAGPTPDEVAGALCRLLRATDLAAHLPGTRFAVLLAGCPPAHAARVADRLRGAVGAPGRGPELRAALLHPAEAPAALRLPRAAPVPGGREGRGRGAARRA